MLQDYIFISRYNQVVYSKAADITHFHKYTCADYVFTTFRGLFPEVDLSEDL